MTAPAFVAAENHVTDAEAYKQYASRVLATLVPFGGVVMTRAGGSVALGGDAPVDRSAACCRASRKRAEGQGVSPPASGGC